MKGTELTWQQRDAIPHPNSLLGEMTKVVYLSDILKKSNIRIAKTKKMMEKRKFEKPEINVPSNHIGYY